MTLGIKNVASQNGRTIGGSFHNPISFNQGLYIAGLALLGEGPRVTLPPAAGGRDPLSFHARTGFQYQIQNAASLGSGSPAAIPNMNRVDADHMLRLPAGPQGAAFYRAAVNP